jgi:macrolide-specific efflux system membrane fusion protein
MVRQSNRRRTRWFAVSGIVLLALIGLGAFLTLGGRNGGEKINTATAERGDIEIVVTALGKIGPKTFVDVGAQASGQLDVVHVEVGDRVEEGQLLAEIDPRIVESRVEADRARVASLQAQINERTASLELARTQDTRNQALVQRGLIARDLADTSGAAVKQAQAQVGSIRAQLREAQSQLEGDLATLGYAKIYAPMAGTVVSQTVLEGQTLNASQVAPTLLRIADLSTMTVTAQVAEADIVRLQVGMPAYFSTLGQPKRRWTGTVRQILPTPDIVNEVVLYKVLIDVGNEDGALLPDMTAQVFFEIDSARDTIVVPVNAIVHARGRRGESTVQVVSDAGEIEARAVEVGLRDRDRAQIVAGLKEGEKVVVPEAAPAPGQNRQRMGLLGGGRGR